MQVKKIAALTALACLGFAGTAQAALNGTVKTVVDDANTNGRIVYIAGASAVQKGFSGIAASMCDTAVTPIFYLGSAADTTGSDYFATACKLKTTVSGVSVGNFGGKNAIILERTVGGSVWGVNAVARAESIDTMNVNSTACTSVAGVENTGNTPTTAFICSVGTANRVPDAGVSDVAPNLFKAPYNTEGEPAAAALSDTELALLSSEAIYALAFGVPVTTTVPTTVTFSRPAIAGLFAGNYSTWDKFDALAGSATDPVVICRRVPGSGTQAVYNKEGGFPCTADFTVPADRDAGNSYTWTTGDEYHVYASDSGLQVIENSTSGDVKSCLNAAANATTPGTNVTYATKDRNGNAIKVTFEGKTGGYKAIGTLSMDSLNGSTTTSKWTFRNLDGAGQITWTGVAGTLPVVSGTGVAATMDLTGNTGTVIDGSWVLQAHESFNIPARTTGDKLAALKAFVAAAKDPNVHAAVTALKFVTAGVEQNDPAARPVHTARYQEAGYLATSQCNPYVKYRKE